jgi:multidrug efflux pump subunit AcrB
VVRNSIILVDFIELRLQQGMPLDEAVIDAGAVRFRPMMLTAAAVIVGAGVILFDPIFQGLAISLMAGEVASLLLSRLTVPILYYVTTREVSREGSDLDVVPFDMKKSGPLGSASA